MPLITDPWFYALAVPAFLLTGISKGGFASGAGNVAVPLMSLVIPAPQAAGIALPVLCQIAPIVLMFMKDEPASEQLLMSAVLAIVLVQLVVSRPRKPVELD